MQHLVRGSTPVVPLVLLLTVGQYSTEWQAVSEGHEVRQEWPPLKRGSTAAFKASVSPASAQDHIELHLLELYASLRA